MARSLETGPPPATEGRRARLLAAITLPDGEVEVHVALGDRRTIGRRHHDEVVVAAISATLDALAALGLRVPFRPNWTRTLGDGTAGTVAVALDSAYGRGTRFGIAAAPDPAEAAARATLHALNRTLTDPTARSGPGHL